MKKLPWLLSLVLILAVNCLIYIPAGDSYPPGEAGEYYESETGVSGGQLNLSFFYDYLSPYGRWVYYPPYRYVWSPYYPGYKWRPYTYGHWIWTDHGFTWVSSFDWGWAPFHYGRWGWSRELGWFWIPDVIWGPAWVTWRWNNIYIGWAPLPPEVRFSGVGRIYSLPYTLPTYYWIFIEGRYFLNPYLYRSVLPLERSETLVRYTIHKTNIYSENNRIVNRGIDVEYIRRVTGKRISKYQLQDVGRPGRSKVISGEIKIYRPPIKEDTSARPKKVLSRKEAEDEILEEKADKLLKKKFLIEDELRLDDVREHEVKILKKTQDDEMQAIKRKFEEEENKIDNSSKREKVRKKYEDDIKKLRKQHDEERKKLLKRHQEEEEKAKAKKVKKKIGKKQVR